MPEGAVQCARRIVVPMLRQHGFIREDVETLATRYQVQTVDCRSLGSYPRALAEVARSDLLFCWFGSHRFLPLAALARALRKPVVIVAGGYDLANVPEIEYGNMRPGLGRLLSKMLFSLADLVLCYSHSAAAEARAAGVRDSKMRVLHLGVRTPRELPTNKSPFVLTVAGIDEATITRKGLLDVARVAKLLPEIEFVLAGTATNPEALARLTSESPPNLKLCGYVPPETLESLFSQAAAYLQPSRHEAFGLSVAEAMSHGCAVIVGDRYSLPEVVGDCGVLVDPQDDAAMCTAVRDALARCRPVPEAAARIKAMFPPEGRARKLLEHVESLIG